jgi:hypothetical protein
LYICNVFHQQPQQTMQTAVEIPQLEATLTFQRHTYNKAVVKFKNELDKAPLERFRVLQDTERPYLVVVQCETQSGEVTNEVHGYPTLEDARIGAYLWEDARVPTSLWGTALELTGNYKVIGIADSGTVPAVAGDLITVYYTGEFMGNIIKQEGKLVKVGRRDYAQFNNSPFVQYVPKRKRKALHLQKGYRPYMLVLKGHGHPEPAELFGKILDNCHPSVVMSQSTYTGFSGNWVKDFEAKINPYLAAQKQNVVIADFREWLGE